MNTRELAALQASRVAAAETPDAGRSLCSLWEQQGSAIHGLQEIVCHKEPAQRQLLHFIQA